MKARELLKAEAEYVKSAMGHGDLPIDAYSQVWEECYNQVGEPVSLLPLLTVFRLPRSQASSSWLKICSTMHAFPSRYRSRWQRGVRVLYMV